MSLLSSEQLVANSKSAPAVDVAIVNLGTGFFMVAGQSPKGKHWVNICLCGAEDGTVYTDDSRLACEIYEAAESEGITIEARREV